MKDLQLVMTNPCSEQWDDMQQTGTGRYCDRCEKNIVDLTAKSDAELMQFFNNNPNNTCGRLHSSQLNRKLVQPTSKVSWQWLMSLAVGVSIVSPAQAQKLSPATVQSDKTFAVIFKSPKLGDKSHQLRDTISGRVLDQLTGKPLKDVKVSQKGFINVLATTDSTGKFQLDITPDMKATAMVFKLQGYAETESSINNLAFVNLSATNTIRVGGVSRVLSSDQMPLLVISAGKKRCTLDGTRMSEISPDWIEKLEILKDAKATALYGAKGANGVILIEIKQAYANKFDFSKKK